jgi:L-cysteine:1D-myo-inositol 2-amino-2-deoxy-alpha-D-glucopyranoside ligase
MRNWTSTNPPALAQRAPAPKIFDSQTNALVELPSGREVRMYVCGITPYDATHMGHAATYLAFDTLNRIWRTSGAIVRYVQNTTDIDDPLLERAAATNREWEDIAAEQIDLFQSDMEALRIIAPDHYVGAVESIPLVDEQIKMLEQADTIYQVDTDYYYDATATDLIGAVSHFSPTTALEVFAQRGGDPLRPGKRNPLDALVWRGQRAGEPHWPSHLGEGRPGWHIECSAIARHYLGDQIDVQGGGSDLKFPHHEFSAAHAQSATGKIPFAGAFVHAGMVALDGEKMSKSKGNLVFVSKLTAAGVDPMEIRLAILAHHYREDWEWFEQGLTQAQLRLVTWRNAFALEFGAPDVTDELLAALANDLDSPAAVAIVDSWAAATLEGGGSTPTSAVATSVDALLGVV